MDIAPRRVSAPSDGAPLAYSFPPGALSLPPEVDDTELSEGLLEQLADGNGYRARDLAESLGSSLQTVRRELRRLEEQGGRPVEPDGPAEPAGGRSKTDRQNVMTFQPSRAIQDWSMCADPSPWTGMPAAR